MTPFIVEAAVASLIKLHCAGPQASKSHWPNVHNSSSLCLTLFFAWTYEAPRSRETQSAGIWLYSLFNSVKITFSSSPLEWRTEPRGRIFDSCLRAGICCFDIQAQLSQGSTSTRLGSKPARVSLVGCQHIKKNIFSKLPNSRTQVSAMPKNSELKKKKKKISLFQ